MRRTIWPTARRRARVLFDRASTAVPDAAGRGIVNQFHRHYYRRFQDSIGTTRWMGTTVNKCPTDLWVYQEIVSHIQPEVIVETGTAQGGSALYLANLCDVLGRGRVISVDVLANPERPHHPRVTYLTGSSTDSEMIAHVRQLIGDDAPVIVILDSDHSEQHVRAELAEYAEMVTPGSFLIVEDTNVNGHPTLPEHGPGPMEAVVKFVSDDDRFVVERDWERHLMTYNPNGYLRRVP
jgi:cephalosporin hydroxylase